MMASVPDHFPHPNTKEKMRSIYARLLLSVAIGGGRQLNWISVPERDSPIV